LQWRAVLPFREVTNPTNGLSLSPIEKSDLIAQDEGNPFTGYKRVPEGAYFDPLSTAGNRFQRVNKRIKRCEPLSSTSRWFSLHLRASHPVGLFESVS
jgi:hypothetical protein